MKDLAVGAWPVSSHRGTGRAGKKDPPAPPLTSEHWNASRKVSFRTPAGWVIEAGTASRS